MGLDINNHNMWLNITLEILITSIRRKNFVSNHIVMETCEDIFIKRGRHTATGKMYIKLIYKYQKCDLKNFRLLFIKFSK